MEDHEQGMVSGLLNTSVQVGGAVFLAVITAVIRANGGEAGSARAPSSIRTERREPGKIGKTLPRSCRRDPRAVAFLAVAFHGEARAGGPPR